MDATFNAIKKLIPHNANLLLYQVSAVTHGTDAQAEVSVRLEENGRTVNGQAAEVNDSAVPTTATTITTAKNASVIVPPLPR